MDYAIQNLMNMEAMLGYGYNPNIPSAVNGYRMNPGNAYYGGYNPYYYGSNPGYYGNYNPSFNGVVSGTSQTSATSQQNSSVFQGLQKQDVDALTKYYTKTLDPNESIFGCLAGAVGFGVLMHPRAIVHPRNTIDAFNRIKKEKIFANITKNGLIESEIENGTLKKVFKADKSLWKDFNPLMQDAYTAMHRLEARSYSKLGLFRRSYSKTEGGLFKRLFFKYEPVKIDPVYFELKEMMEKALKSGDVNEIAKATELLNSANVWDGPVGRFTKLIRGKERLTPKQALENAKLGIEPKQGFIGKGLEKLSSLIGFGKGAAESAEKTGTEKLADKVAKRVAEGAKPTFKSGLKRAGIGGFLFFVVMDLAMGASKIKTAREKDKKTGRKQLGQTLFKSTLGAAGWTLGEAGALALYGAKWGTRLSPGIGTAIGALVGMIGGSLGMWGMSKISKGIVGQDVADKIEAEKLAQTQEGQMQLLQTAYEAAQKGDKHMDAATQQALYRALNTMA